MLNVITKLFGVAYVPWGQRANAFGISLVKRQRHAKRY